jgi:hypothetical protein
MHSLPAPAPPSDWSGDRVSQRRNPLGGDCSPRTIELKPVVPAARLQGRLFPLEGLGSPTRRGLPLATPSGFSWSNFIDSWYHALFPPGCLCGLEEQGIPLRPRAQTQPPLLRQDGSDHPLRCALRACQGRGEWAPQSSSPRGAGRRM